MATTYTEAEINARHKQRFAVLAEVYGDKFKIPADVMMKLHEKNRLEWVQFNEERDGKRKAGTPTPVGSDVESLELGTAATASHAVTSGGNPASNGSAGETAENSTGPKPIAVVDNENDREVARFSTVAAAKEWLANHPNRDKVERHEYIIIGFEPDGVNPPPMNCDGCGEMYDAHDLEPYQDNMLCAPCVQVEDDLHAGLIEPTSAPTAEEYDAMVDAAKEAGVELTDRVLEQIAKGEFSIAGYLAGRAAGERAVIIPQDDNVRAAPQVVDVGEGVEFHYGITDKNPVGDLFPTVVYTDDDLIS